MHECPEAQEVWQAVAAAWKEVTQEALDVSTPRLTVMGEGTPTRAPSCRVAIEEVTGGNLRLKWGTLGSNLLTCS